MFYTNADSLLNKKTELEIRIRDGKFDVVCVSEILPKTLHPDSLDPCEWKVDGYKEYTNIYTLPQGRGRGVLIYVKESLISSEVLFPSVRHAECIGVDIKLKENEHLLVQCVYRSPSLADESLPDLAEILLCDHINDQKFKFRAIVGDFNIKRINWDEYCSYDSDSSISSNFIELVKDSYLTQHVRNFTRYREGDMPSILDLVFTNDEDLIDTISYGDPLGKSDHISLEFSLKIRLDMKQKVDSWGKPKYFRGDYDTINGNLGANDWERELMHHSVEESWTCFTDKITIEIQTNIPVSKSYPRARNTPWMTPESLAAIKAKRKAWNKYINCRSPANHDIYRTKRAQAKVEVKRAQTNFERNLAMNIKTNPKAFWKYVRSKRTVKDSIDLLQDQDGTKQSDSKEKATILNQYFSSVFTEEDLQDVPILAEPVNLHSSLNDIDLDRDTIIKLLKSVNTAKSQGSDNIHPKFIAETAESIVEPLLLIFRQSLDEGKLPSEWKTANVSALHKKGPKTDPSNYRPISLTSVVCKIFEKVIRNTIMDHMESNDLFSQHQHGFRKGRSCITQLIEVLDKWTEELDTRHSLDTIYLDFRKAFDTVPHLRLLNKLQAYGIRGKIYNWIKDFLTDRKQRVVLNGISSDWTTVTSGIPQGSVLGPVLFLIFINDLPEVVENYIKLFADDTKLYARVGTDYQRNSLQKDIDSVMNWSDRWQLRFNTSKCKHLHLGPETNSQYQMEGRTLERTPEEKDLGVTVDETLKFQSHISTSVKKANRKLGFIYRTFTCLDKDMFLNLYKSLVRPHLEYGSTVWSVLYKKDAISIENVQRRALDSALKYESRSNKYMYSTAMIPKTLIFSLLYERKVQ